MNLINGVTKTELLVTGDTDLMGIATAGAKVTDAGHLTITGILNSHLLLETGSSSEIKGVFDGELVLQPKSTLEIMGVANIRGKNVSPESVILVHAGAVISGQRVAHEGTLNL